MIVFPQALILSEATSGVPLTHGRILIDTLTRGGAPTDVTVSGETEDGPADAPLRPETNEYWEPDALPATWEYVFPNGIATVNALGIAGHDLGTKGCSITVETSMDGVTWEALGLEHVPSDDAPIMFLDDDRSAARVRISIAGAGLVPRIAVVYVGLTLDLQRAIYGGHSPINLSRETIHNATVSKGGQYLGQSIRSMGVVGSVNLVRLSSDWYRENFDPFVEMARQYPFFYAWRPQTFPREVVYIWTTDDMAPTNMGKRDLMEVSMKVRGIGWVANNGD